MLIRKDNPIDSLYHTKRWEKVKKFVIARDRGRCQICNRLIKDKFIIHHIEIATQANFFDPDNLELLDIRCHNSITFAGGKKRAIDEIYDAELDNNDDLINFK